MRTQEKSGTDNVLLVCVNVPISIGATIFFICFLQKSFVY